MSELKYSNAEVELTGFFAEDRMLTEKRPGILVVHGGAGLDEHAKRRANRFAGLGFVAFACDMYGAGVVSDRERVMATVMELSKHPAKLRQRVSAGLAALRANPHVDGRIAAVGYCFGGLTALELARSGADVLGVVSVHGSLHTSQPAQPESVKARILVCHGCRDPHVPMRQVDEFVEEMKAANVDFQLIVYGLAMHGFTHEDGSAMSGVAYDALADARSQQAIQTFLSELFDSPVKT